MPPIGIKTKLQVYYLYKLRRVMFYPRSMGKKAHLFDLKTF